MAEQATLTIRLPEQLWQEPERETSVTDRPVESVVTDMLRLGLQRKRTMATEEPSTPVERREKDFFDTPLGKYVLSHADPDVTLEDVRAATAGIKGTMAAAAIAEREERL